jgi:hypothetical protein
MYLEFTGGYEHMWEPKTNPIFTMWHEVYPVYCQMYEIKDWVDNCNGVLSYCDNITLFNFASEQYTQWHVEELSVDITVQEPVHDVAVISVTPLFTSVFQGWPDPITVDVQNQGDFSETFTVSVYYGTNPVTTSPITVTGLAPGATQTLKFCWVTTKVPLNTYTITANASIVAGETDTADNTLSDGTVAILAPPPFYWKDGFCDYAPSGMPDFDQKQDAWVNPPQSQTWTWCGPVAVANSLWWLDSKFEPAQPPISPPSISDGFPLVSSYVPGLDDHDPGNVQPFIQHLAYLMDTDAMRTRPPGPAHTGTNVVDMEAGLTHYLSWTGVNQKGDVNGDGVVNQTDVNIVTAIIGSTPGNVTWNMAADIFPATVGWPIIGIADNKIDASDLALVTANLGKTGFFYEHTVNNPDFNYIEQEVEKSQDVVLLVGYWIYYPQNPPGQRWYREGGHFVTVAGVNSTEKKIAISDPCYDAFENSNIAEGRVPIPHLIHPGLPNTMHNDAALVSHDIYSVAPISDFMVDPNPNGTWTLVNYVGWQPTPPHFTVIESAVITSPIGIHDVAVTNVTNSKSGCVPMSTVGRNLTANVNVAVTNQGNFTETFNVTAYANTTSIASQNVTLSSGDSTTITFTWNTTGFAYGNYLIWAYAWPVPGETVPDTVDNAFADGIIRVSCIGDIDGTYSTTMIDYQMVKNAIPSTPGSPKWNPNADINNDGVVSMIDFQLVKIHVGEHV